MLLVVLYIHCNARGEKGRLRSGRGGARRISLAFYDAHEVLDVMSRGGREVEEKEQDFANSA